MRFLCLFAALSLLSSCAALPEGTVFSWGDTDVHYDQSECPDLLRDEAFRYPAWRGEKVFAQAVFYPVKDMRGVSVSVGNLVADDGVIPASSVKARFVRYVWADDFIEGYRQCGKRNRHEQDSLLVADMVDIVDETDVQAGKCQPVWVTVEVPSDTPAGTYSGTLEIKGRGLWSESLPIELQVVDRLLPEPRDWKFHLDLWQNPYSLARVEGVELWSEEHFKAMRPVMQMLADAGQKVITATIIDRPWNGQTEDPYGSMVTKTLRKDGSWEYGYDIFDKWVEFMMSLGIDRQINCYSLIPWKLEFDYFDEASGQMASVKAEPSSNEYKIYWMTFLSDFACHLREKGWFEKTMIAMDERPAESMKAAFDVIYSADPDFKVSFAGKWHPEIEAQLDDYCVAFRTPMPADVIAARRAQGKVSTYYTCCAERYPNIFTVSPLSEAVWISWYALAGDYDGYLRWAYNHWTAEPMKDTRFRTWTSGDCYCVYPQGRTSLRFDKLIEGIQDYEKVCILRDEWTAAGDKVRLDILDEALEAFDYEVITSEGAANAVHNAKSRLALLCSSCAPKVDFAVSTLPESDALKTSLETFRFGNGWDIDVSVKNVSDSAVTFKLVLSAAPGFRAEKYLIPGINYNGNHFGDNVNLPQGWERNGEPWIFSYDRGSIPSCTISENDDHVFALFASDKDAASYVSACSMERLEDGSFCHKIYWPVTEAPLVYDDKLKFSERYDTYLTLAPGEEFKTSAVACMDRPLYPNYGFASIFPVAWKRLNHHVPLQRSVKEVMRLDKAFQDWGRRQDEHGYWYSTILDDMKFRAGYYGTGLSDEGYSVEDYEKNPSMNRWHTDDLEQSKNLKPGEYVYGYGRELGFAGQSFQTARLSIVYGFENNVPEDVDFGLKVLRSWIEKRRFPNGVFKSNRDRGHNNRDASNLGWAISELVRVSALLESHGMDASEFEAAASKLVSVILPGVREDGALGSMWDGETGEVVTYNGDGGGFMLMGLVRYWLHTGDDSLKPVIDNAFRYYYEADINDFRCFGGAMDCASTDKEGIQPFFTSAKLMYEATGDAVYLDYARKAAWYFASWMYIHNPLYDEDDDLTVFAWKPAGANIVGVEHPALDEYGALLLSEYLWLSRVDDEPLWRELAELIWRNGTQGFADEHHRIWHGLERPLGSKNEAIFPSQWSKYHTKEFKRGSINDHLTSWGGVYRTASIYDMTDEDRQWLENIAD